MLLSCCYYTTGFDKAQQESPPIATAATAWRFASGSGIDKRAENGYTKDIERALPVSGWPHVVTRSNRFGWSLRRLLLVAVYLDKQAANADDH